MQKMGVLTLLALLYALPAGAETGLVKLQTGDAGRGWMGVGKLVFAGREFCTGALVAPDLVLTAAHCLYDKDTGERVADSEIQFLDGWRNGRAEAYRGVRAAVVYPGYDFGEPVVATRVSRDLALVALDQPILLPQVTPFAMAPAPDRDSAVSVVSYAQDRAEAPSLQQVCHVIDRQEDMLVLTCDVDFGASGAPIFTLGPEGGPQGAAIVSVISAKAEANGQKVALASAVADPLPTLRAELEAAAPLRAAGVKMLMGGGALTAGGAKVVKAASQP